MDLNIDELKKANVLLHAELARLLAESAQKPPSSSVPAPHPAVKVEEKKDKSSKEFVKEMFELFGKEEMDADDLVALAATLGEMWDDDELHAAFQALGVVTSDSDDNGQSLSSVKIGWASFYEFWSSQQRMYRTKGVVQLNLLRLLLASKYLKRGLPRLLRKLAESKPSGYVHHKVHLGVGPQQQSPGSSLDLRVSFLAPNKDLFSAFPKCGLAASIHISALDSASPADIKSAASELESRIPNSKTEITKKGVRVFFGVEVDDPLAETQKLGVDMAAVIREVSIHLSLREAVTSIFKRKQNVTLASVLHGQVDVNIEYAKDLVYAVGESHLPPEFPVSPIAFIRNTEFNLDVGDIERVAEVAKPPPNYDQHALFSKGYDDYLESLKTAGLPEAYLDVIDGARGNNVHPSQRCRGGVIGLSSVPNLLLSSNPMVCTCIHL